MTVSSVTSLAGIDWTELNGLDLTQAEKDQTSAVVAQMTRNNANAREYFAKLWKEAPVNQKMSINDIRGWIRNASVQQLVDARSATLNALFPPNNGYYPYSYNDATDYFSGISTVVPELKNPNQSPSAPSLNISGTITKVTDGTKTIWVANLIGLYGPGSIQPAVYTIPDALTIEDLRKIYGNIVVINYNIPNLEDFQPEQYPANLLDSLPSSPPVDLSPPQQPPWHPTGYINLVMSANEAKWEVHLDGFPVFTLPKETTPQQLRETYGEYVGVFYLENQPYADYEHNPFYVDTSIPDTELNELIYNINHYADSSINDDTKLSIQQWFTAFNKLKEASFREASKLDVKSGGGIKTYNNQWFVNGETVSYMDVFFAVRVNQLFVINNTITDNLKIIQKNNAKIKLANVISAAVSALSPNSTNGTVNAQWVAIKVANELIKAGVMPMPTIKPIYDSLVFSSGLNSAYSAQSSEKSVAMLFSNTEGGPKNWLIVWPSGAYSWTPLNDANPLTSLVGVTNTSTGNKISEFFLSDKLVFDLSSLKEYLPSSINKLFDLTLNQPVGWGNTLNQTDCNTITTELKSLTSGWDSDNQLIQTQLTQYNDKRTEVLDQLSTVVKGQSSVVNDMARNLSYV